MMNKTVLIVSSVADLATDRVVEILIDKGIPVFRVNTEDFPYSKTFCFSFQDMVFSIGGNAEFHVDNVNSIWYRRFRSPSMPKNCTIGVHDYIKKETYHAIKGALLFFNDQVRWMSHPLSIEMAESKPYQLYCAKETGFLIPETIITYDSKTAMDFFHQCDEDIIGKPVRSGYYQIENDGFGIYTQRLNKNDVKLFCETLACPVFLQRNIKKNMDIRVTIVGNQVFSAGIDSQKDPTSQIDWRKTNSNNISHFKHSLPEIINTQLIKLMRKLKISFGAADLILDTQGNYYFLEVNPSGQWLWIEDRLDFPISKSIADWLSREQL